MLKPGLFLFGLLFCFTLNAQNNNDNIINGRVFLDKNQNGVMDRGEKPLKKIPVSNGDTIVLTNRKGEYFIPPGNSDVLFPILPTGFNVAGSNIVNSNFYNSGNTNHDQPLMFGLYKTDNKKRFRIGAIGDVQVGNDQEMNYALQSVMTELANRNDLDFTIYLGDLVNDNTHHLPLFRNMLENLPFKSWTVRGNHDRDKPGGDFPDIYTRMFGPPNYSFNYSNIHFIILNNIYNINKSGYEGRYTPDQIRFVKNTLALVPNDKMIVLCQHIPMPGVKNNAELLDILENRKEVLVLSGHTHRISRHYLRPNIMEITAGATCGSWWTGERDYQGIPDALMQDGSPRGYFVIDFDKNGYNFRFKGVGQDPSKQMTIWINKQDSADAHIPGLQEMDKSSVLVNIFAGSVESNVQMQINNGQWYALEQVKKVDPNIERYVLLNKLKAYPTHFSKRAALRNTASHHIWKGVLPDSLPDGIHTIRIVATEPSGWKVEESKLFRFYNN